MTSLRKPTASWAVNCPVRDVLDRCGDRWSILVLHSLESGTLRFTVLKKTIGDISQRMLAKTLRRLQEDGFVSRRVYPTVPPQVDYSLTPLGRSLMQQIGHLVAWADAHHQEVRAARETYKAENGADSESLDLAGKTEA
ncbi:MAG TPA: helix-turn-helix domain-containing protein [Chthoniobacterales bacterium]